MAIYIYRKLIYDWTTSICFDNSGISYKFQTVSNFYPLEFANRGSETQLQFGEHSYDVHGPSGTRFITALPNHTTFPGCTE